MASALALDRTTLFEVIFTKFYHRLWVGNKSIGLKQHVQRGQDTACGFVQAGSQQDHRPDPRYPARASVRIACDFSLASQEGMNLLTTNTANARAQTPYAPTGANNWFGERIGWVGPAIGDILKFSGSPAGRHTHMGIVRSTWGRTAFFFWQPRNIGPDKQGTPYEMTPPQRHTPTYMPSHPHAVPHHSLPFLRPTSH